MCNFATSFLANNNFLPISEPEKKISCASDVQVSIFVHMCLLFYVYRNTKTKCKTYDFANEKKYQYFVLMEVKSFFVFQHQKKNKRKKIIHKNPFLFLIESGYAFRHPTQTL